MKFILTVPIALLFTACPYPSHLIRVNESLPKNAPVEKETIVAYAQGDWGVRTNSWTQLEDASCTLLKNKSPRRWKHSMI